MGVHAVLDALGPFGVLVAAASICALVGLACVTLSALAHALCAAVFQVCVLVYRIGAATASLVERWARRW